MIKLFSIPKGCYDLSSYDHILHGSIVKKFEDEFAKYIGAKYACVVDSCTNAIFLTIKHMTRNNDIIKIPSMIPPVVVNAIYHSGRKFEYVDNYNWIGNSYTLFKTPNRKIIDSAQRVDRNQYSLSYTSDRDIILFSFYPTKPIHGIDGGMIVTNDKYTYDFFKNITMNGLSEDINSWDRTTKQFGWKMYMNSLQCHVALDSLMSLDTRKLKLADIRHKYNEAFKYNNISDHIYRIFVDDNRSFLNYMYHEDIICGIHYPSYCRNKNYLPNSMILEKQTVSIPYHENLSDSDINKIIEVVSKYKGDIYDQYEAQRSLR